MCTPSPGLLPDASSDEEGRRWSNHFAALFVRRSRSHRPEQNSDQEQYRPGRQYVAAPHHSEISLTVLAHSLPCLSVVVSNSTVAPGWIRAA